MSFCGISGFRPLWQLSQASGLFRSQSVLPRCPLMALDHPVEYALGGVRGKKVLGKSNTRNKCGHPKGKKRGVKVFDGQRVPIGSLLISQRRMDILPGWNVNNTGKSLYASCNGRVMITTEVCDPKVAETLSEDPFAMDVPGENIYKMHMHIVPDQQHQYFKLTEQV
ncbi:hypothetical protein TCAL_03266 [Tigriopus californicus]|uniref:39S ribosomal protein L27, mitochondrial n=1 Tax=Tigriopus californicus TaxID=6832 RepID=A0A553NSX1_TIGCA|nr:uncharacterized protein LOC131884069 [Tigriopus californicus]TRY68518.1 hypothetical protein TCAL_03266 [Tigriopus californicus]